MLCRHWCGPRRHAIFVLLCQSFKGFVESETLRDVPFNLLQILDEEFWNLSAYEILKLLISGWWLRLFVGTQFQVRALSNC
jgi:hypothetical protein